MNRIWTVIMLCSITIMIFVNPTAILPTMITAGGDASKLVLNMLGIYVCWMGIMGIFEATGAGKLMTKLLRPIIKFLFGDLSEESYNYLSLNISSNLLGMGNAATPMGVRAVKSMNKGSDTATDAMIMLFIVNATCIELLPTTVISIRTTLGSANPSDIILPTFLTSLCTTIIGIILAKLCAHGRKKLNSKKRAQQAVTTAFSNEKEIASV